MRNTIGYRMTAAMLLGTAVTAVLILLMQALIDSEGEAPPDQPPGATLSYLRLIEETPPPTTDRRPEKPPKPWVPPTVTPAVGPATPGGQVGMELHPPTIRGDGRPVLDEYVDGEALAVVKVRPVYPTRAQQREIEGYVLVEFTIDELGRVVDVRVIEAEPRGVFDRAALEAVERFRYKPRVVNGQPIPVTGVKHLLTFELGPA